MQNFLSHRQKVELQKSHREAKLARDIKKTDRIKAILMLNRGDTYEQIAEALLLDDATIRRCCERYQENGADGLDDNYKGNDGYLSQAQKTELKEHLRATVYRRAKDIVEYIKRTFKVKYTEKGVVPLLHGLGFSYKKPKRVPGKADAARQEAFVAEYRKLKEHKGKNDPIYFMDAMHPQHNVEPVYGWIEKGVTKEVPSNTGRARLNINGALNSETHEVVFREDERINAQSTVALLQQIEQAHACSSHIYVIADNAPYNRSREVKEFLARSKIELILLPPYAPNLNLIERLWRFFRENVCSHYYEHFAEFRKTAHAFLRRILDHKEQLATLLAENFEITGKHFSQTSFA
jgi:transposase